jgi:deoxyribose-phosphate aldolase
MVKGKAKITEEEADVSQYMEEVKEIPKGRRKRDTGKYYKIIESIAKSNKKRNVKILLESLNTTMKSAYPSFEKALKEIAKQNGVDFTKTISRKVTTKRGDLEYVKYPEFDSWKKGNMRIRVSGKDLFIEKLTDKLL